MHRVANRSSSQEYILQVVKGGVQAGKFVGGIARICGGGGGGRPNLAQAGGRDASKLGDAETQANEQLTSALAGLSFE